MAEPIKINTGKYNKQGKVEIDGKIWSVRLPGAGTEMRLSQAFRRSKLYSSRIANLDKKIEAGNITDSELDSYEEYCDRYDENEKIIFDFFLSFFKDSTKNNSEVKKWVNDTPTSIIELAFEDVKNQANQEEGTDGQDGPSEES